MNHGKPEPVWKLMGLLFQSHPWHGVPIGDNWPEIVTAYIEIVPTDTVKYELDKASGLLKIDRPQRFSNVCPTNRSRRDTRGSRGLRLPVCRHRSGAHG